MPKKASAKSTKGKKGKGKASKKLSRRKDTPQKPEQPSLKWPWQAATTAWLDHRLENRAKILREFRGHYLFGDGIVTSHDEWLQSVKLHTQPFASKQVESLVQLLVTLMLFEGDERHPAHNGHIFAAALRFRHGRRHFERMQEQLAAWFEIINRSSNFQQLLNYIISQHQAHDDSHVAKETVVKWLADNPIVISNRPDIPNELDKDVLFPVLKRFAAYLMHTQLSACKLFQTWDTTGCGSVTVEHTLNVLQVRRQQNSMKHTTQCPIVSPCYWAPGSSLDVVCGRVSVANVTCRCRRERANCISGHGAVSFEGSTGRGGC
eukprot:TRINITY_DN10762_c0_g2_i4.p1 TRINITY_DN10762_c0_g2~~TRINITY_DN10762_c0_g2_i4.p1  ORF type:complete len:336 (+),score=31.57 TRINITY_DN10762_c0_g2_i4:51-1010(+)